MTLYNNLSVRVHVNSTLSGSFNLLNGTRLGFPLSPIIFSLAFEAFAEAIRSDPLTQGLRVGQCKDKIGLFADNINFVNFVTIKSPQVLT